MKIARFVTMGAWAVALLLIVACSSGRGLGRHSGRAVSENTRPRTTRVEKKSDKKQKQGELAKADTTDVDERQEVLDKKTLVRLLEYNAQQVRFVTAKVKFMLEVGTRQMTLTGNLKMKRDDVIRLQLMAFGFVEAGRLEFTKEYVLIVDRINKQYLQVPYEQLDFLRNSNIDFHTLQALFWNEINQTDKLVMTNSQVRRIRAENSLDTDVVLAADQGKIFYRWLTDGVQGRIKMANIMYSDYYRGNYELNWDYQEFKAFERKFFPTKHHITFTAPEKVVEFDMQLNRLGKDEDWETRTLLSGKYRQVSADEILRRFMNL